MIDNEKGDKSEKVEYVGGCFADDDIAYYETA